MNHVLAKASGHATRRPKDNCAPTGRPPSSHSAASMLHHTVSKLAIPASYCCNPSREPNSGIHAVDVESYVISPKPFPNILFSPDRVMHQIVGSQRSRIPLQECATDCCHEKLHSAGLDSLHRRRLRDRREELQR